MGYLDYTYVSQVFTMDPPRGEVRPEQIGEPTRSKKRS
jgi:hypothetical protein